MAHGTNPGWFAMVMATGIVSVALLQAGFRGPSIALGWLAASAFAVLTVLSACRAAAFGRDVRGELTRPEQVFSYFAVAAAASVLASRLTQAAPRDAVASAVAVLTVAAALAWISVTGLVVCLLTGNPGPRPAIKGVNGTWQLWVVGTQSAAIAAVSAYAEGDVPARLAAVAALVAWSAGTVLYPAVTALVLPRLARAGLTPEDPFAPYWVTMGAASITVLAATQIIPVASAAGLTGVRPVLTGAAVVFWSVATALIPVLTAIGLSRRLRRHESMRFRRELWMIVFPAGMYATASMRLGADAGLPPVRDIGLVAVWPAVAAWTLVFAGMVIAPVSPPRAPRRYPWRSRRRGVR